MHDYKAYVRLGSLKEQPSAKIRVKKCQDPCKGASKACRQQVNFSGS